MPDAMPRKPPTTKPAQRSTPTATKDNVLFVRVTPEMHAQIAEVARRRNEQAARDGDLRVWSLSDVVRDILSRHLRAAGEMP